MSRDSPPRGRAGGHSCARPETGRLAAVTIGSMTTGSKRPPVTSPGGDMEDIDLGWDAESSRGLPQIPKAAPVPRELARPQSPSAPQRTASDGASRDGDALRDGDGAALRAKPSRDGASRAGASRAKPSGDGASRVGASRAGASRGSSMTGSASRGPTYLRPMQSLRRVSAPAEPGEKRERAARPPSLPGVSASAGPRPRRSSEQNVSPPRSVTPVEPAPQGAAPVPTAPVPTAPVPAFPVLEVTDSGPSSERIPTLAPPRVVTDDPDPAAEPFAAFPRISAATRSPSALVALLPPAEPPPSKTTARRRRRSEMSLPPLDTSPAE